MKLILLRHGRTQANLDRLYCGRTDLPVLPQDLDRLRALAPAYPPADVFYSSPLLRARQTLAALYGPVPVSVLPGLAETDFGLFEMKSYETLKTDPAYCRWLQDPERLPCPGGESAPQVLRRALAALEPVMADSRTALCLTHGGVIAALLTFWFGGGRYDHTPAPGGGFALEVLGGHPVRFSPVPIFSESR